MNGYGMGLAAALLLCAGVTLFSARPVLPLSRCLPLCGVSAACGVFAARLVYWLGALDSFMGLTHGAASFFWFTDGGFSLFGAVAGALGAAWLLCRKQKWPSAVLDAMALPALLFVAAERLLEWTACGMNFGMGLDKPAFLTVPGEYGPLLNAALAEVILLALMAAGLMIRARLTKQPNLSLRDALFLIGLVETLMNSVRRDNYMMWDFVHQEQLYFYLLSTLMAVLAGLDRRRPLKAFAAALLTAGIVVFLEFALDGRVGVPFDFMRAGADAIWYGLFILALSGLAFYYFRLRRPVRKEKDA